MGLLCAMTGEEAARGDGGGGHQGWRERTGPLVAASTRVDMVTAGTLPSAS